MNNRDALIWLTSIKGVNIKTVDLLENKFKELKNIWEVDNDEILSTSQISDKVKFEIIKNRNEGYYENLIMRIRKSGANIITYYDEEYPANLRFIENSPKVLYVKGQLKLEDSISISIVGSRKSTSYGKWVAEKITTELSELGVTIISGLAKGIDTYAHINAIKNNARTIAVLGSGVDIIYPQSNRELYYKIQENGCIISEFPLGTQPFQYNFPQRNRIISGLSLGVVVVEAREKSGSLITAHHAIEQGREVFAVPGNINSLYSKGTNLLIKDGAKIVTSIEDIIEEIPQLKANYSNCIKRKKLDYSQFSTDEIKVLKCIADGPVHCDVIVQKTGINITEINSILTILEIKGAVKQLPGRIFLVNNDI